MLCYGFRIQVDLIRIQVELIRIQSRPLSNTRIRISQEYKNVSQKSIILQEKYKRKYCLAERSDPSE